MKNHLELIKSNFGLVKKIASRYARVYGWNLYEELIDEGYLVLVKCAYNYQEERGKFSSYLEAYIEYCFKNYMKEYKDFYMRRNKEESGDLPSNFDLEEQNSIDDMKEVIKLALEKLNPEERFIINHYFGIGTSRKTLKEIGILLDYSHGRISQKKEEAIQKLKEILKEWKP